MRLHLQLTPNTYAVPFSYQHKLTGVLHKWLGQNDLHDEISLYSFSWLRGKVKPTDLGLHFPQGARWFISFWDDTYTERLKNGISADPEVAYGIKVKSVREQPVPEFGAQYRFKVSSPVLVRKNRDDLSRKHLTYKDDEAAFCLKRTLNRKLEEAGIPHDDFKISFDQDYSGARTKLIDIRGVRLKANLCPVLMEGDPKVIEFAWNVGLGELTGSGFGALT